MSLDETAVIRTYWALLLFSCLSRLRHRFCPSIHQSVCWHTFPVWIPNSGTKRQI